MTPERKLRLGMAVFSILLVGLGIWVVLPALGWRGLIGLLLLAWANNIGSHLQRKREQDDTEKREHLEQLLETIKERLESRGS